MDIEEFRELLKFNPKGLKADEVLQKYNAYWVYGGKEGEYHALLSTKKHSGFYCNVNYALEFPNAENYLAELLANKVESLLEEHGIKNLDCIVSSSFAAITFGKAMSSKLGVASIFTEKKDDKQVLTGRFELPPKTCLLQGEELITTLNTTKMVNKAVLRENPDVIFLEIDGKTIVVTIVHRPDKIKNYPDYKVVSIIEKEVPNWEPEKCPLCEKGSKALPPKPNWSLFMSYNEQ